MENTTRACKKCSRNKMYNELCQNLGLLEKESDSALKERETDRQTDRQTDRDVLKRNLEHFSSLKTKIRMLDYQCHHPGNSIITVLYTST